MNSLIDIWKGKEEYKELKNAISKGLVGGVTGLPLLPLASCAAALFEDIPVPFLLLCPKEEDAQALYDNLSPLLGERVRLYPSLELLPFEVYAYNIEVMVRRIDTLYALANNDKLFVVASVESVLRKVIPPGEFKKQRIQIKAGSSYDTYQLSKSLSRIGYERSKMVEIPGSFSLRGSIMDIFPINYDSPVRIEFFGDEIESIRYFSPDDQLSRDDLESITIIPGRELPLSERATELCRDNLRKALDQTVLSLKGKAKKELLDRYSPYLELLEEGIWDSGMEQLLTMFYPQAGSLIDYLNDGMVLVSEPDQVNESIKEIKEVRQSRYYDLLEAGRILPSFYDNFLDSEELLRAVRAKRALLFSLLPAGNNSLLSPSININIAARQLPLYFNNYQALKDDLNFFKNNQYRIIFSASSKMRLSRVEEIVKELDFPGVSFLLAGFSEGFESSDLQIALISERELLAKEKRQVRRRHHQEGKKINNFLDLEPGDYVVHVAQGIGRYLGVERLSTEDVQRDYLLIQYAGEDKLYLPVDQLDLIQKYSGKEGKTPKINKLGGSEWQKVKKRVRKGIQDMAKELLALYAARNDAEGYAFKPDSLWQKEFEDAFIYPETTDQLKAVEEIKKDMESTLPMDRLLCGDVGYGKTEVALRAAFKAVDNGKQVAVLVPTTVLAQQHLRTFSQRFKNYPVNIACLSRFASAKQQKDIIAGLKQKKVDILIGTHRLLSKDVVFNDLGLLIVDEEQRFGVAHKEKIKALKKNIDVLTLSATPIPRTLHMALVGMRDMSIITSPPEDRHPVQTYVLEYHERLIKDIIKREIARNGQVFFVHNRVQNIYNLADKISALIPEANVMVAHGQMKEKELEKAMLDFVEGEGNVLVCTTIIESGLDIPNVNTLIVNESDYFGLSQLYQLRGRVGRSERQAFAYFTYRKDKLINEIAKKRLIAIRDFTELGSGFKIAMRDMEIRGAGNILGPEQHGFIADVGFDLYCRLLKEEIDIQSGEKTRSDEFNTILELQVDAFIPDQYIEDSLLKVEIYRRISEAEKVEVIDELLRELLDRYGSLPEPVENLLLFGRIRIYARALYITSIRKKSDLLELVFKSGHPLKGEDLVELAKKWGNSITFREKKDFTIIVRIGNIKSKALLDLLIRFLADLYRINIDN